MFMKVYTGRIMHFGNAATSRAEGAHSFLKKHIGGRAGDLLAVFYSISNAIGFQIDRVRSHTRGDDIHTLVFTQKWLYQVVKKHITRYRLRLINGQHLLVI